MTEMELRDKLSEISLWQRIQALAVGVLVMVVVVLWLDVRSASVRLRWAERGLDQLESRVEETNPRGR